MHMCKQIKKRVAYLSCNFLLLHLSASLGVHGCKMTSEVGTPLQLVFLSCEVIFLLHNRLRSELSTGKGTKDMIENILEDVSITLLERSCKQDLFRARLPFSVDEVRDFFRPIAHECLKFDDVAQVRVSVVILLPSSMLI